MKSLSPNDSGQKNLVSNCRNIKIQDFLRGYQDDLKEALIKTKITALGVDVHLITSRTNFNGVRFWFQCPICKGRVGILYQHPLSNDLGCRKCLNLDYHSRRYKGMLESSTD